MGKFRFKPPVRSFPSLSHLLLEENKSLMRLFTFVTSGKVVRYPFKIKSFCVQGKSFNFISYLKRSSPHSTFDNDVRRNVSTQFRFKHFKPLKVKKIAQKKFDPKCLETAWEKTDARLYWCGEVSSRPSPLILHHSLIRCFQYKVLTIVKKTS